MFELIDQQTTYEANIKSKPLSTAFSFTADQFLFTCSKHLRSYFQLKSEKAFFIWIAAWNVKCTWNSFLLVSSSSSLLSLLFSWVLSENNRQPRCTWLHLWGLRASSLQDWSGHLLSHNLKARRRKSCINQYKKFCQVQFSAYIRHHASPTLKRVPLKIPKCNLKCTLFTSLVDLHFFHFISGFAAFHCVPVCESSTLCLQSWALTSLRLSGFYCSRHTFPWM